MKRFLFLFFTSTFLLGCELPVFDMSFKNGFLVRNMDGSYAEDHLFFENNNPSWEVAQWHSITNISNAHPKKQPGGSVVWQTPEKWIQVGPEGSMDNDITLAINTDYSYDGRYRKEADPKDWPHLYIGQRIAPNQKNFLGDLATINLNFEVKLHYEKHIVKSGYKKNLHGAEYLMYFTVQNLRGSQATNPNYGKYFWFGVPIYDVRYKDIPKFNTRIDKVTESYIYKMPYNAMADQSVHSKKWVRFHGDILPYIKEALRELNEMGVEIGSIHDLKLGRFLFGWEVTSLFIGTMKFKNLNLVTITPEDIENAKNSQE